MQIDELRQEKSVILKPLKGIKDESGQLQKQIDKLKGEQVGIQTNKESIQKQLDKINAERNALRSEISTLKAKKDKNKEAFYKALIDYERQQ